MAAQNLQPKVPGARSHLKKLNPNKEEIQALAAFLLAVTATQYKIPRPDKLSRE